MLPNRSHFPEGFLFGTSTSAYQIEGHAFGGAGPTHWDTFAATPGNVIREENGRIACNHLDHWEQDLDLIKDAGFDVYRFSTSWARVLPEGRGAINTQGLDFYDRLVDGMLERGIKPALTLYHWELPAALADLGGWRNRDIANWFADFTDIIAQRLGDRIWSAAPINEPWCVAWLSHFMGIHAPGLRDIRAAARAMHHVLLSHGRAIEVMRAHSMSNLGAVCNFEYVHPATNTTEDLRAGERYDAIYNRFFLSGLFKGTYPDEVLAGLEEHLPKGWQDDFNTIRAPLDWLGLNYYTCKRVAAQDGAWPNYQDGKGHLPTTEMGWEIYPQGLTHFLTNTARNYTGDLPLYVTENGMAAPDQITSGHVQDDDRIDYFAQHLAACQTAIDAGVPLKGYFSWSLMDNYEWSLGYEKRFGLVHVDFETGERRPKASWHAFRAALRGNNP